MVVKPCPALAAGTTHTSCSSSDLQCIRGCIQVSFVDSAATQGPLEMIHLLPVDGEVVEEWRSGCVKSTRSLCKGMSLCGGCNWLRATWFCTVY
jgi:hypothetical protein